MKRTGNLFDQVFTRESLYQAYLDSRRKKRGKRAIYQFEKNLGAEIDSLYWEIHAGIYQPRPYRTFRVYEPKERVIYAPAFRDRVVQHAIYRSVCPIFDRTFVKESFACRVGLGTHKASMHTLEALRACDPCSYTLKMDIRKFFYRIDRSILRLLVERKIKDERLITIMMHFADYDERVGVPIGNLLSQLFALLYLNPLDHYIKRDLKVQHYARYVDDILILGVTRPQALEYRARIKEFLADNLHLEFSKTTIAPVSRGVNFVGYRTWRHGRMIRKHSLYKFKRAVKKKDVCALVSLLGHAKETQSLAHLRSLIQEVPHEDLPLPKRVRRTHNLHSAGRRGRTHL